MTSAPLASSAPREQAPHFHAPVGSTPLPLVWTARTSASHAPQGTTAASRGCPIPWRQSSVMQGEEKGWSQAPVSLPETSRDFPSPADRHRPECLFRWLNIPPLRWRTELDTLSQSPVQTLCRPRHTLSPRAATASTIQAQVFSSLAISLCPWVSKMLAVLLPLFV